MSGKKERYARLVREARESYPTEKGGNLFTWSPACRDEINLWTYWQGRECLEPEILVVGQDWGNPDSDVGQACLRNIENQRPYLENNPFPSDRNLAVLFEEGLGIDIRKRDERLFFTNLILGYRTGKNTGRPPEACFDHDLGAFRSLVGLLSPKVVICLGKDTFVHALRAFGKRAAFPDGYIAALSAHENMMELHGIRFYGMSHCGTYGCKNRGGRGAGAAEGLALQIEDWKQIRV